MLDDDISSEDIDLSNLIYKEKEIKVKEPKKEQPVKKEPEFNYELPKPSKKNKKNEIVEKDDAIEKIKLMTSIKSHIDTFPDKLKKFNKINLDKKNIEELTELLREMTFTITCKINLQNSTAIATTALNLFELMCVNYSPLKVEGLTVQMINNEAIMDDIKLLMLKRMDLSETTPELRLSFSMFSIMVALHAQNSMKEEQIKNITNNTELNRINQQFNDI